MLHHDRQARPPRQGSNNGLTYTVQYSLRSKDYRHSHI
ncbi:unnamed protein product [Schistosoma margrebowiei]|uniref:Uncharacterized protein n=1 Tax=Schistosoma margrebowiei TaxID=48269 RepID=A0A3P8DNI6_9TREM|nr:unnamed protein product [Schistosoma margrebowiei]